MPANFRRTALTVIVTAGVTSPGLALAQQSGMSQAQQRTQQNISGFPAAGRAPIEAEPDPNVSVQDRPRPDYDPLGIRAGSFFVYPELRLGGLYDSNVYASDDNTEDEYALLVTPRIQALSNWNRHQLSLDIGGEIAEYPGKGDLNYQDFYIRNSGRLDINQANQINESFSFQRDHEDPSSPDFNNGQGGSGQSGEVTKYYTTDLNLAYRHDFARFFTVVGGQFTRYDFEDNDDVNEDDRDRNQYLARARLGYQISPRLNTFVQTSYDIRRYDETPNDQGFDRNSQGVALRGGLGVDLTSILFGEVSAGYSYRKYSDSELDSFGGFGYAGSLTWNVTPLTTVILQGAGDAYETTVEYEGDTASADYQKSVSVGVTHELLRNLLINGTVGYVRDDFEGTDRSDNTYLAGAGLSYLINRHLSLDATYDYSKRSTNSDGDDYDRNVVRFGVTAKL